MEEMSKKQPEMEKGEEDLGSSTVSGQEDITDVEKAEQSLSVAEGSEGVGSLSAEETGVSGMEESAVQQGEEDQAGEKEGGIGSNEWVAESAERGPDEDTSGMGNEMEDDEEDVYEEVDNDEDEMDELEQTEGRKSPNKIQDLVNKAIESKLTGFQEQMQKMMAVLQTVSHGQAPDEKAESEADIFEIVEEERDEEEEVDHIDEEEMRMAFGQQEGEDRGGEDSKPSETSSKSDTGKKLSKDEYKAVNEEKMAEREKMLGKVCSMLDMEPIVEVQERQRQNQAGVEVKYTVLPVNSVIKDTWNKPWTGASSQIKPDLIKRYRWPQEDMEKYGRTMKIEPDAERLVRLVTGRKKGRALTEDVLKVFSTTKTADSFVRFQQKIISYAAYFLEALGKNIRGEKEAESDDVEEVFSNLQQCLVDLCDVSVLTNSLLIRNQRRIYLNSMKIGHQEVKNELLNLPITTKMLFGDSLTEVIRKYGLDPPKMNLGQNEGGSRRADGRQGGNVGGIRNAGGGGGGGGGRRRGGQNVVRARKGGEMRAGGNRPLGRPGASPGRMGPPPGRMGASPGRGSSRGSGGFFEGRRDDRDRIRGVNTVSGMGRRNEGQDRQQGRGGKKRPSGGNKNNSSKRRKGSDSKPMGTSWQPSGSFGGGYMPLSRDLYPMGPGGMEPPSKMDYGRLLEEKARLAASKEHGGGFGSSFDTGSRSTMYPPSSLGGGYYRLGDASSQYRGFMSFSDSEGPLLPKGPSGGFGPSKQFSSYSSYANDDLNQY